jgi:hypothetical protein
VVVIGVIVAGSGVPEFIERNWLIAAWTQGADTNAAHEGVTAVAELGSEQPCPTIGALINGRRSTGPSGRQNRERQLQLDGLDATWPACTRRYT